MATLSSPQPTALNRHLLMPASSDGEVPIPADDVASRKADNGDFLVS
ncbi:MAG: hypothetical protein P1U34_07710 [Coxiellaceae bacterium]|nr:hypothetical protein [Coxiellaceae bacterium]